MAIVRILSIDECPHIPDLTTTGLLPQKNNLKTDFTYIKIRVFIMKTKLQIKLMYVTLLSISLIMSSMLNNVYAQIQISQTDADEAMQEFLIGDCIAIDNLNFKGNPAVSLGSFTGGNSVGLGFESGIVLTTGKTQDIGQAATIEANSSLSGTGDPDYSALAGIQTKDVAILEFDFIPTNDEITFNYVFASEEYPEYVCSSFNDVFGFFISGPGFSGPYSNGAVNIAWLPDGITVVGINTVNPGVVGLNGASSNCPANGLDNSSYYVDNTGDTDLVFDGYTVNLTATINVTPCETYHFKIGVADAKDTFLDSAVFLEGNSFDAGGGINVEVVGEVAGTNEITEGCPSGYFRLSRNNTEFTDPIVVDIQVSGTATSGTDYFPIPSTITIPAGQDYVDIDAIALVDSETEGNETIILELLTNACSCGTNSEIAEMVIIDQEMLTATATDDVEICEGASTDIEVFPIGGRLDYTYNWSEGAGTTAMVTVSPSATKTYNVTVEDACGNTVTENVTVTVIPFEAGQIDDPGVLCVKDGNVTLTASPSPGSFSGTGIIDGATGEVDPALITNSSIITYTPDADCTNPGTLEVFVEDIPTPASITPDEICEGEDFNDLTATPSNASYTIAWYDGDDPATATLLGTGNTLSASDLPSYFDNQTAGSYVIYFTQKTSNCESDAVDVTVTVNRTPNPPQAVAPDEICEGDDLPDKLSAYADNPADVITWYDADPSNSTANELGTGTDLLSSDFPGTFDNQTAGTYSVWIISVDGDCESTSAQVDLIINPNPQAPTFTQPEAICEQDNFPATIEATPNTSGNIITWYDADPSGGTAGQLATGNTLNSSSYPTGFDNQTAGTYTVWITEKEATTSCEGAATQIDLVVNPKPAVPTANTADAICAEDNWMSEVSGTPSENGNIIHWYDADPSNGNANELGTGNTLSSSNFPSSFDNNTAGDYSVWLTETNSFDCESDAVELVITVNPKPAGLGFNQPDAICVGADFPASITANPSEGTNTIYWYDVDPSNGTSTEIATGNTLNSADYPSSFDNQTAGTYSLWITEKNSFDCEGEAVEIVLTVNANPQAPTFTQPEAICEQDNFPATIEATPNTSGNIITWYDADPSGGTAGQLATGNTLNSSSYPTGFDNQTAGTYTVWITEKEATTSCEGAATQIDLVVNPKPAVPTANTADAICAEDNWMSEVSGTPSENGNIIHWYDADPSNGNANELGTGNTLSSSNFPSSFDNNTAGDYSVWLTETNSFDCESDAVELVITVNPKPAGLGFNQPDAICVGADFPASITANPSEGTNTIYWYDVDPSNGTSTEIATGNTLNSADYPSSFDNQTAGTYSLWITEKNSFDCEGEAVEIVLTVNANPQAPTFTQPEAICEQDNFPATIEATPNTSGNIITWYDADPSGGTAGQLATGNTLNSSSYPTGFDNQTAGTYMVWITEKEATTSCEGAATQIDLVVNPKPAVPTANTADAICAEDNWMGEVSGTPSKNGNIIHWYDADPSNETATELGTGNTLSSSNFPSSFDNNTAGDYSVWLTETNSFDCESDAIELVITVNPKPADLGFEQPDAICVGADFPASITANPSEGTNTIYWYDVDPSNGTSTEIATGNTLNSADYPSSFDNQTAGTYSLWITEKNTFNCEGEAVEIVLTVNDLPLATDTELSLCEEANEEATFDLTSLDNTVNSGTSNTVNWYENDDLSGTITNANAYTSKTTTVYAEVINVENCSAMAAVDLTVVLPPFATFAEADSLCNVNNAEGSTINLNDLITDGDTGGTWTEDGSVSGAGASVNFPNIDFEGVTEGSYSFTYTTANATAPCENQSYTIDIYVKDCECKNVDVDTAPDLCSDANTNVFNLDLTTIYLGDDLGHWEILTAPNGSNPATIVNDVFDATDSDAGTYEVIFVLDVKVYPGCPEQSEPVSIKVAAPVDAGEDGSTKVCNDQSELIDLFSLLGGNPQASGTWTVVSGNPDAGAIDLTAGTFNPNLHSGGIFEFEYTLTAELPCESKAALVTVEITELPDAGWTSPVELCDDEAVFDLNTLLNADATTGGKWTINGNVATEFDAATLGEGQQVLVYTVGEPDCQSSMEDNITVLKKPVPHWSAPLDLCSDETAIQWTSLLDAGSTDGGIWTIDGTEATELNPSTLGAGSFDVLYKVVNGICESEEMHTLEITLKPTAGFTLTSPICINDLASIEYTGNSDNTASYTWELDGGMVLSGSPEGIQEVQWSIAGEKTISLMVDKNGCTSETITQSIIIDDVLEAPVINCNSTYTTIDFDWAAITNASDYKVSVDGTDITVTGLAHSITDLQPGTQVPITVEAISDNACPNTSTTIECETPPCPDVQIELEPVDVICLSQNTSAFDLVANVTGNINGIGTWSGTGITDETTGTFDPQTAGIGKHDIIYTFEEAPVCVYTEKLSIFIYEQPVADFNLPATFCVDGQNTAEVNFTGQASFDALYNWDFGTAEVLTGAGQEGPYQLTFSSAGTYDISLSIEDEGACVSETVTKSIEVGIIPETPAITCGETTTHSVQFNWNAVNGATAYELTIQINNDAPKAPIQITDFTYTEGGLSVNDEVTLTLKAIGDPLCGDSETVTLMCQADDCPGITASIDGYNDTYCNNAQAFDFILEPAGGKISIDGTEQVNTSFNPATIGEGLHNILYVYTDPDTKCEYTATAEITVNMVPDVSFNISAKVLCSTEQAAINYTGTASPTANYNWDFDGGTIISGSGQGPYEIKWDTPGQKTLSLSVEENACISQAVTQSIDIYLPLETPQITCSETTTSSVTFEWNDIPGATEYEITYTMPNGSSNTLTQTGTDIKIEPLSVNEKVSIEVKAIETDNPCGASDIASAECTANDCPDIILEISGYDVVYCKDDGAVALNLSPQGGILYLNDVEMANNNFVPQQAGVGIHDIVYKYTDPDTQCEYETAIKIQVNAVPVADFMVSETEVCMDEVTTLSFTGTAGSGAIFNWDFEGGNANPGTGLGPQSVSWNSAGTKTVSLYLEEDGCVSTTVQYTVKVKEIIPAPAITCLEATTTSVIFEWEDVPFSTGYEITYTLPDGSQKTEAITDNNFKVDNLNVNDEVNISVIILSDDVCGNSEAGTASCTAQDCPDITASISGYKDSYCINEMPFDLILDPQGGTLFINNQEVNTNTIDFNQLGKGTHHILYEYKDDSGVCTYTDEATINVYPIPDVSFNVSVLEMCLGESVQITYTGSAAATASYDWDFNDADIISGSGQGPYEITWTNAGTKTISLSITENACASPLLNQEIEVKAPLEIPVVYCKETSSTSITFAWNETGDLGKYEVSYTLENGTLETEIVSGTEILIDNLNIGETVGISITALGEDPCGDSEAGTGECKVSDCNLETPQVVCSNTTSTSVTFDWQDITGATGYQITYTLEDGTKQTETITVSEYEVTGLQIGETVSIEVTALGDATCNNSQMATIDCTASDCTLETPQVVCGNATSTSVTFDWQDITGATGYQITYTLEDGSKQTETITVSEYEVTGLQIGETVSIELTALGDATCNDSQMATIDCTASDCTLETPQVVCSNTTSTSVTFDWQDITGATGYQITYTLEDGSKQTETITDSEYEVTGLQIGETVSIEVTALGDATCNDSQMATIDCTASDCTLETPQIVCGNTTSTSVTFDWQDITGATGYQITYTLEDGSKQTETITDSEYEVTGLQIGETVSIEVTALGDATCNDSQMASAECTASDCTLETPTIACGEITSSSVSFDWSDIAGAIEYQITYTLEDGTIETYNTTDNSLTIDNLAEGESVDIEVTAIGDASCNDSETASLTCTSADCPDLSLSFVNLNDQYCENEGLITLQAQPAGGTFTINGNAATNFDPQDLGTGSHTIIYTYEKDNCVYQEGKDIFVIASPVADFSFEPDMVCIHEKVNFTFTGTADNNAVYEWNFGNGDIQNKQNPNPVKWNASGTKQVTLTVSDPQGNCSDVITMDVKVSGIDLHVPSTMEVLSGKEVELTTTFTATYGENVTFEWDDSEGIIDGSTEQSPVVSPEVNTTYYVTAISETGCTETAQINLNVTDKLDRQTAVPSAFSPNGDGHNDYFYALGANMEKMEIHIFDRWGNEVYSEISTIGNVQGWDGTYEGKKAPVAAYAYYILVTYEDGYERLIKGNLSLIR